MIERPPLSRGPRKIMSYVNYSHDSIQTIKNRENGVLIKGMRGLGDNIFQRGHINQFKFPVWLDTPWPELFEDLPNVKFVECSTPLRTQSKNVSKQDKSRWSVPSEKMEFVTIMYGGNHLKTGSIQKRMTDQLGVRPIYDLPKFDPPKIDSQGKPIALIRPVTLRREWFNSARNPDPRYIYHAASILMNAGYYVVSVCDLETGKEWIDGMEPPSDLKFHKGELGIKELLGLVQISSALVGGVGWLLPASMASKVPMFVVAGGNGEHNAPEKVSDEKFFNPSMLTWAFPDHYCRCADMKHSCNKTILGFTERFGQWIRTIQK